MGRKSDILKGYPDEALLEEVRRVAELVAGPVLTKADFTKHSGVAASDLARRFGGWRVALERAGLAHMYSGEPDEPVRPPRFRYSDEELLEEVRRVAGVIGKPVLIARDFKKHSQIGESTLRTRFGGWRAVLERAGVGNMYFMLFHGAIRRYSDEDLLEEVRRVARIVGKPVLSKRDFQKHSRIDESTLRLRLGSWRGILERAGVGDRYSGIEGVRRRRYPDDELLGEIRRVAGLLAKPVFTRADFDKHSDINSWTLMNRFGSWWAALERAGVANMFSRTVLGARRRYPDEDLLDEIRRVAGLVGKTTLTRDDFAEHSAVGCATLTRRFGGWLAALQRAGLANMCSQVRWHPHRYSDEELLEEVRRVAGAVGKPVLSRRDFQRHSRIDESTLRNRLGGWRGILERAGVGDMYSEVVSKYSRRYSDEELLEEIRRVAGLLARPVFTRADFDEHSDINSWTLRHRFGSWRAALERGGVGNMYSGVERVRCCHSDEGLLEEVRRVAGMLGKPALTKADFDEHSDVHPWILAERFGSWRAALERAGVGNMLSRTVQAAACRYPEEALLEEIRRVARLVGKPSLTRDDFAKYSRVGASTLRRRFGGWLAALRRAGAGNVGQ